MNHKLHMLLKLLPMGAILILPFALAAQDSPETPGPIDLTDVPPVDTPDREGPPVDAPPPDIQEFIAMMKELQSSFLTVVQADYDSGELRAQAIQEWLDENRSALEEVEAVQEAVDAAADATVLPDDALSERPAAAQGVVDLEALLDEKLSGIAEDNEALENALETAAMDREERLAALMEARDARLADMEAAKELARQKRDEARENSQGDRRPDDDPPGGG